MSQRPVKWDAITGNILENTLAGSFQEDAASEQFVAYRNATRQRLIGQRPGPSTLSAKREGSRDLVEEFVEEREAPLLRRLEDMESASLTSAILSASPWSGFSWPLCHEIGRAHV